MLRTTAQLQEMLLGLFCFSGGKISAQLSWLEEKLMHCAFLFK